MDRRSFDEQHFKSLIRNHAENHNLSQAEIADKADVAQTAVSGWLNERKNTGKTSIPKLNTAVRIAEALGVSLDYLATGREYWHEMDDERLKRLVLQLRHLDDRSLDAVEAAVTVLMRKVDTVGESSGPTPGAVKDAAS